MSSEFMDLKKAFEEIFSRPVSFHAVLGRLAGNALAGLMLSQACYWSQNNRSQERDGWFFKTRDEWLEETCMTRWEQEAARKQLVAKGYLEEQLRGVPARLWYRVKYEQIWQDLMPTSWWSHRQLDGGSRPNKPGLTPPALNLTENTPETTPENTHKEVCATATTSFQQFWDQYPRKNGGAEALSQWNRMTELEQKLALAGIELWKRAEQWNLGDGRYIPYASTFLKEKRYLEEPWVNAFAERKL